MFAAVCAGMHSAAKSGLSVPKRKGLIGGKEQTSIMATAMYQLPLKYATELLCKISGIHGYEVVCSSADMYVNTVRTNEVQKHLKQCGDPEE